MDERQSAPWSPPPPPWGQRLLFALQRYSFPIAVVILLLGAAALLLWTPSHPKDELSDEELEELIRQHEQTQVEAPSPSSAYVFITTEPPGATVFWNMDSLGATPLFRPSVETGAYALRLTHDGYLPLDTFVIVPNKPTDVSLSVVLQQEAASEGDAPVRSGMLSSTTRLRPSPPQTQERPSRTLGADRRGDASRTGWLTVATEPSGASVLIDGVLYGQTPHTVPSLLAGTHEITLQHDGYAQRRVSAEVTPGDTTRVLQRLERGRGTLQVIVEPWGTIYVDDVLHQRETDVQYTTSLTTGYHIVRAEHPVLGTREQAVRIRDGQTTHVVLRMSGTPDEAAQDTQERRREDYQ